MKKATYIAIFDMDGTVFKSSINWSKVRKELNIGAGKHILNELYRDTVSNSKYIEKLEEIEYSNTQRASPVQGIEVFLEKLKENGISKALLTNNSSENTLFLLKKYNLHFDMVVTRESGMWKPGPSGLIHILKSFRTVPENAISIGDSDYDIRASLSSGIERIFIKKNTCCIKDKRASIQYFSTFVELGDKLFREN